MYMNKNVPFCYYINLRQIENRSYKNQLVNEYNIYTSNLNQLMKKSELIMKPFTQQGAFRKDRNALNRAKKKKISTADIINKMAETHSKPNSAQAFAEAAGAVIHVEANMNKETPIYDAIEAIFEERRSLSKAASTT